jgi:hypothetical protein
MLFTVAGEDGTPIINLPGTLCLQLTVVLAVLFALWKRKDKLPLEVGSTHL